MKLQIKKKFTKQYHENNEKKKKTPKKRPLIKTKRKEQISKHWYREANNGN